MDDGGLASHLAYEAGELLLDYRAARSGQLKNFTGIDSPYEAPETPEITVNTVEMTPQEAAEFIVRQIMPLK